MCSIRVVKNGCQIPSITSACCSRSCNMQQIYKLISQGKLVVYIIIASLDFIYQRVGRLSM